MLALNGPKYCRHSQRRYCSKKGTTHIIFIIIIISTEHLLIEYIVVHFFVSYCIFG